MDDNALPLENTLVPPADSLTLEPVLAPEKPENPFVPDKSDLIFALTAFVLGYIFSRWVFFTWRGWGVAAFTTLYLASVTAYLIKKGVFRHSISAWFWFAVTWLTGLSHMLWDNAGLERIQGLFLFCAAAYFVLIATGRAMTGGSGNFLLLDGLNAVILIPFRNFVNQYASFKVLGGRGNESAKRKKLPIFLGVVLALLLIACLVPPLMQADSGGFTRIFETLARLFRSVNVSLTEFLLYCIAAVPVAAYMYGLVSGSAHGRNTGTIPLEGAKKTVAALRVVQPVTVYIALGAVCALYIVFIACQIPYFFSAFSGTRPEGYMVYSEYARKGFFELCRIAAVNLAVITAGNVTCVKKRSESVVLTALNMALALITLLLIATAISKMALYIGVYGLSMPRLLTCVFMVFLAAVFIALIVLQKRSFSIVRFALILGSVMFCALCLTNPDAIVVRYNTSRYLSGTLSDYDTDILYRAGAAGVVPALEVFNSTRNEALKNELSLYFQSQSGITGYYAGTGHALSYETYTARAAIAGG